MNRTLNEATVKRYYYETHGQLRSHLADFVTVYNFGRKLKTLKRLSPTNTFAASGKKSQPALPLIQSTNCRD